MSSKSDAMLVEIFNLKSALINAAKHAGSIDCIIHIGDACKCLKEIAKSLGIAL